MALTGGNVRQKYLSTYFTWVEDIKLFFIRNVCKLELKEIIVNSGSYQLLSLQVYYFRVKPVPVVTF